MQDGNAFNKKLEVANVCKENKLSILVVRALTALLPKQNGTAQGLFQAVEFFLKERNIPLENNVGFGNDNCSSMMGKRVVLKNYLKMIYLPFLLWGVFVTQWHFVLVML